MKLSCRVCLKYTKDEEVLQLIKEEFLRDAKIAHYIPWDVTFSGSISTMAMPTFIASKKTSLGTNSGKGNT